MARPFVHDLYAPLAFRPDIGDGTGRPRNAASWLPDADARRIVAYQLLAAYADNVTRFWLPDRLWQKPDTGLSAAEKFREYGDAALLVEQGRSLLLGDSQDLTVPDADPLPEDATPEDTAAQQRAVVFADWWAGWAEDERLWLRLVEGETNTVGLGDGVYVLGWDAERARPRLRVYDPGMYFPVLTDDQDLDEYPNRVHLVYEEELDGTENRLHRITYSRERLPGEETRRYPWQEDGEPPSAWTVYLSHAWWPLNRLKGAGLYDLSDEAATYTVGADGQPLDRLDLQVDFVPVVHVPNDAAGARHFGRSLLLRIAQLLDDLAFTDTDLQGSSEQASASWVTRGAPVGTVSTGPGAVLNLPQDGSAELVDTSKVLEALLSYDEHLLDRLSVNSRLAAALLGRVKPNEVPSGYALELGFAATRSLIREMRLVRSEKYPLILKFAARFAQANNVLPAGLTPRGEISLGSYLPADRAAAVDYVTKLLPVHGISLHTAVRTLIAAGFPVEDAQAEVDRIKAEWPEGARLAADATGSEQVAADWLGVELPAAAPAPPTPPAGG